MNVIKYHEKIDGTLVAGMYFRFKVEQMDTYPDIEKGGRMGYRPNLSAVAMYEAEDKLIGAIVFECHDDTNGMHIWAAYIVPEFRGQKHYEDLWDTVIQIAKRRGILYIDSSTHRDNKRMTDLYEKQGRIMMGTFWILPKEKF